MSGECDKPGCPICQELYGPQEIDPHREIQNLQRAVLALTGENARLRAAIQHALDTDACDELVVLRAALAGDEVGA